MSPRRPRFTSVFITLVLVALLAGVACGGGAPSMKGDDATAAARTPAQTPSAPTRGSSGGGSLIITKPEGLVTHDISTGKEKPLITPTGADTFLLDPAVSPDGTRIAYVQQPPANVAGNKYDAGSDLWIADRDGGNPRALYLHEQPNQLVRFPQWQDRDHVLAIVQEITSAGGPQSVTYTLERVDAGTGERTKVREDVLAFGVSADATRIAYARLALQTGETLDVSDVGGGPGTTLVGLDQSLSPFNSPRFSPDGTKVAFASADQTGARADQELVSANRAPSASASLDGLPEDIWIIDAAGGQAVRLADLKEDLPALTWDGDGKHIYVIGSAGLYDVSVASGAVNRIGDGAFHGQIAWVR